MDGTRDGVDGDEGDVLEMTLADIRVGTPRDGYLPVTLATSRGDVECRYYAAEGARRGALFVGGIGGGFDTPARGLYPRLCREMQAEGIAGLRVQFRHPTILEESVLDVLAGLTYLLGEGIEAVALVGHSFGGAVAIQAASLDEDVRTVVTLATQSYGTAPVADLAPRCSLLLIHGTADGSLPHSNSQHVHRLAREPKRLLLYEGAGHGLDEAAEEVHRVLHDWIVEKLLA